MKKRIARGGAVALLIAVMAVTPLSVVFSAGRFETWLPGDLLGRSFVPATLVDETGLVRAISHGPGGDEGSVVNPSGNRRVLTVSWLGGCGDQSVTLTFGRSSTGYAIRQRTFEWGCPYMIGIWRSVAIYLWSPVDASTVTFDPEYPIPSF